MDGGNNQAMSTGATVPQPSVQAQLSVRNGRAAVEFYKAAFGAVEVYRFGGTDDLDEVVAQLAVGDSLFGSRTSRRGTGTSARRPPGRAVDSLRRPVGGSANGRAKRVLHAVCGRASR
jgi:catechol 2,3-dioxygenase-like lactoylglutathione lyase family enzyme